VNDASTLNAGSEAFGSRFLFNDFAMVRTSGEYIALPGERQSKSVGRAFPAFVAGHVNYTPFGIEEVNFMSQDYLLKTEPSEYSFADLLRDAATEWEGVSNPAAVKNLREMSPGARLIIYETGARKSAVGTATVVSVDASDLKNPKVKIKAGKAIAKPVSLAEIKIDKRFKDSLLVRMGRLSVVPLTKEQYAVLAGA
jgi:predicted RNA-binding protein with PUA-like domain